MSDLITEAYERIERLRRRDGVLLVLYSSTKKDRKAKKAERQNRKKGRKS